jgi:dihydrofolate synthase/folylpolyglutamate synthase
MKKQRRPLRIFLMTLAKYDNLISRIEQARDVPAKPESLERMRVALAALKVEFPVGGKGVVLVAGTNGKGTVAKTLETLFAGECGAAVGLFTSPHLMRTTERIRSFGRDLSDEEFVAVFEKVETIVDKYVLSHFEIMTLMMAEVFFGDWIRPRVSWAVIEVGVGGRLDPTRLIPHATSVVTTLALDHVDLLGPTLREIAREKFAIVDDGGLLVHRVLPGDEIESDVARICAPERAIRRVIAPEYPFHVDATGPTWVMETPWGETRLSLPGQRAVENSSLALTVFRELGFDPLPALSRLTQVQWPCRMERFRLCGREVYLSGDHNPEGVASLAEILRHLRYRSLELVVGIGAKKDAETMLQEFSQLPRARLRLTTTPFRGAPLAIYGNWLNRCVACDDDPAFALKRALKETQEDDLIVCTGSLYMVGTLREQIVAGRFRDE